MWINRKDRQFKLDLPSGQLRIYEMADEYDGEGLARMARQAEGDVIMEGFCLMAFEDIRRLADWHFHLRVPWDVCVQRRRTRGDKVTSGLGWMALGERGNELLTGFQRDLPRTTVLDGTLPAAELADIISASLDRFLVT